MRILFTGGGTGGHVFPIIAVARQLKQIHAKSMAPIGPAEETGLDMYFLGPDGWTKKLLKKEGIRARIILAGKLRRYFSVWTLFDLIKMPFGLLQSLWYLYFWMPDVIFSKGGYGSMPVVLIGWLYRIPILIHESDTVPGLANRWAAKLSQRIALSFDSAKEYFPPEKTALVGNPVRSEVIQICQVASQEVKEEAKKLFQISGQKPIIFIVGGSQGAHPLNEFILQLLPQLLEKYEIIHQVGSKNYGQIEKKVGQNRPANYHFYAFLDENQYAAAYLLADLVISRAGAGTIFEIAACTKPSILIPLPQAASDHQKGNAFAYARAGATLVIEQANLTGNLFLSKVDQILSNPELVQKMSQSAQSFYQPEAAQKIGQALIEMGQ
jgi:UDP-N-acetylglucosamine--N-acetylmuramyl-(pentapeptide) pyrophosphoryl-undecaprenol N-acetylglucosamine transferase